MAVDDDIIRKNPAKDALGDNGEPAKEKMALTPSQQNRLLSFVERSSVYNVYLPMLQIMIGTGCRCGELIGLTWADVDMEKKEGPAVFAHKDEICTPFNLNIPRNPL